MVLCEFLYIIAEVRPITPSCRGSWFPSCWLNSSVMPSLKYSWLRSLLRHRGSRACAGCEILASALHEPLRTPLLHIQDGHNHRTRHEWKNAQRHQITMNWSGVIGRMLPFRTSDWSCLRRAEIIRGQTSFGGRDLATAIFVIGTARCRFSP